MKRPRLYYGWIMLLAVAFTETISWGVLYYAFTVFLLPMQKSLGWSTTALTGAFSLALLCSGGAALIVGRWLDRYGTRLLMALGSCAASLLLLAWAGVQSLVLFYVIWIGLGIAMAMTLYDPAFALVATWFQARRARALTLLTFIAGFASVIFVPLAQWLIEHRGWRGALIILALLLAIGTVPLHALILRRHPADLGLLPDGAQAGDQPERGELDTYPSMPVKRALKQKAFWGLTAAFALNALVAAALLVHLVPYLLERGYSTSFAASMVGLIGLMALPGRLLFTMLGERIERRLVTALLFFLQVMALLSLLMFPGVIGIFCFVGLFGAGFGAITPARAALIAEHYGAVYYARISSVLSLFLAVARAIAPVGAGGLYDLLKAYTPIFWTLWGLSLLATGIIWLVKLEFPNERERTLIFP